MANSTLHVHEAPCAVLWPSIGVNGVGRLVGRLIDIRPGWDRFLLLSRVMAAVTIPISLGVFAWNLLPFVCRRYRVTNRRIIIEQGYTARPVKSIGLGEFEAIEIQTLAGQRWLRSGDLVLLRDGREVFRLPGLSHPETRRAAILRIRSALLSVQSVLEKAPPAAAVGSNE